MNSDRPNSPNPPRSPQWSDADLCTMLGIDGPLSDETREAAVALMVEFCASSRTVQASLNMEFREITNGRNMLAEAVATLQDEGNGPNEKMPASRDIQSGGVLDGVTSLNRRLPHSDIDREEEIKRMIKDTQTIRDETALFEKKTREVQMKLAAEQAKKESLAQLEQRERELTAQLEELSHIPEEVQASVPKKAPMPSVSCQSEIALLTKQVQSMRQNLDAAEKATGMWDQLEDKLRQVDANCSDTSKKRESEIASAQESLKTTQSALNDEKTRAAKLDIISDLNAELKEKQNKLARLASFQNEIDNLTPKQFSERIDDYKEHFVSIREYASIEEASTSNSSSHELREFERRADEEKAGAKKQLEEVESQLQPAAEMRASLQIQTAALQEEVKKAKTKLAETNRTAMIMRFGAQEIRIAKGWEEELALLQDLQVALLAFRTETNEGEELALHSSEVACLIDLVETDTSVDQIVARIPSLSRFPEAAIDQILDLIRPTKIRIASLEQHTGSTH